MERMMDAHTFTKSSREKAGGIIESESNAAD